MKKAFGEYKWLTGRGGVRGSLWLGGDHLLVIENQGFILPFFESYRRIDYRNIQAITYAKSRVGLVITLVMACLLALLALVAVANLNEPAILWVFGSLTAVTAIALAWHLWQGPTCACCIQTAVQVLKLRPVKRSRVAARVVAELEPLCVAHQAALKIPPPIESPSAQAPAASAAPPSAEFVSEPVPSPQAPES